MVKLFILIRRKGTKRFLGAIPAKGGATKVELMKKLGKQLKPGFSARIVNRMQLKRVIEKMKPRRTKRIKRIKSTKRRTKAKRRK